MVVKNMFVLSFTKMSTGSKVLDGPDTYVMMNIPQT